MEAFLQRMIHSFQEQVFQRMPPERKARKLAVMKALAKSVRAKNKENSKDPLNNNMALSYNFTHSTPMKNQQVTDLDDVGSEADVDTDLTESELCSIEGGGEDEEVEKACWRDLEEPKLVVSKIYDLGDVSECGDPKNSSECPGVECVEGDECVERDMTVLAMKELGESDKHWRSLEVLHETAEYEFCRSLEQSKLFVSTASLLEEIEADLPSPYSLAKPLNHTFHTLTSYRTQTRLARMDSNVTCPEILKKRESLEVGSTSNKLDHLEMEAMVQKALAEQAEKALILSRANKFFGVEHVESEKALLLANLRHNAALQEAKKLRMLGQVSEKENFGQITLFDICFEVNDSNDNFPGKFICTATEREHIQCSSVVDEVVDGKLLIKEPFKFQNLSKDFVVYVDLFKLRFKEPKKALMTSALIKKLKKMAAVNHNRDLIGTPYPHCGFECVSQSEMRLENVVVAENYKCVLQNYLTGNQQHPVAGSTVSLLVKTDVHIKSKQNGFLNVFQQTWNRRWFSHSGYFLESWLYPEHQESAKTPLDSIYLPDCTSIKMGGLEVCIRPHSFVITMKENNEKILFSANSHKDMLTWVKHLNLTLEQIHLWKPNV